MKKGLYIAELDGIRAISVVFVLLVHATYGRLTGGFLGVDIFFVLSGYLITRLMHEEYLHSNTIHLYNFYMRRVLRIIPPLLVCIALSLLLSLNSWADFIEKLPVISAALFFFANFIDPKVLGDIAHTWSLSIEEQFYLFWPAVFLFFLPRSKKILLIFSGFVILLGLITRFWMLASNYDPSTIYSFTFARIDSIMVGCLLAVSDKTLSAIIDEMKLFMASIAAWFFALILLFSLIFMTREIAQSNPVVFTLFAFSAAGFIFFSQKIDQQNLLRRFLVHPITRYVGTRSYGLYLFHYPIFWFLEEEFRVAGDIGNYLSILAVKLSVSFIVTEVSWRLVEKPILKFKKFFLSAKQNHREVKI